MPLPNITSTIEDQSTRVSTTGTYNAGVVIAAKKGEVNVPYLVTSQTDFLRRFTPNNRIEVGWDLAYWEAYTYLGLASNLYVVRAAHTEDLPTDENDIVATYGGCVIKTSESENDNLTIATGITNPEDYTFQDDDAILIYGSSQGAWNNDISIQIVTDQTKVKLEGAFQIRIYNNDTLVETKTCSLNPSLKDGYGVSCYIETALQSSNYVRAISNAIEGKSGYGQPKEQTTSLRLGGGNDGSAVTDADRIKALAALENMNNVNISLVWDGGNTTVAYQQALRDLCDKREESCHAIISTTYEDEVDSDMLNAIQTYRNEELNINSCSVEMYTPHQLIYDEFNDRNIYVSPGCYVTAMSINNANDLGWHWAVAGYNRGIVPSLDTAVAVSKGIADQFSDIQVNTIIKDPGYGNVIMDEQTMQATASDRQDAHTSRYLDIYLRPRLKESLRAYLFEFNDEETRSAVKTMIDTFLQTQTANRALYAFRTVCDETNNLASDIQNNTMNVWVYVKPTKIAKWINNKIIVTPYSVDLESIEI